MASNSDNSSGPVKRVRSTAKRSPKNAATNKVKVNTKAKAKTAGSGEANVKVRPRGRGSAAEAPDSKRSALFGATFVREREITQFLRQLIMMLHAGTPLLRSLKTLARRGQGAGRRALVQDIADYVEEGNPLWQAFDRHPRYFSPIFVNLIKASEASGTLTTVLDRLVRNREKRDILKKRIRGAMLYPVILVLVSFGVMFLIAKFVIPQFEELFESADITVPQFTQNYIAVTNFVADYWWIGAIVLVALVLVYKLWFVRNPLRRLWADRVKLRIPIIGQIVLKNAVVELCRTMALLLRSGMSMMQTLDLVRNAINNQAVSHTLQDVRDAVERGEGIEQPLREADGVIPPVVTDMLVTGEEAGQLDDIADQVADVYEEEVEISLQTLGEALVPILTVIIGIFVATLALAVFVPMISMMEQLGQGGLG